MSPIHTIVKRHVLKYLLVAVRALVLAKRFLVWLAGMVGHFFVWAGRPLLPHIIVPAYRRVRLLARQFNELSPDPHERWAHVATSRSAVLSVLFVCVGIFSVVAAGAPLRAGIIPGAHTILFNSILGKGEADWQEDDIFATSDDSPGEGQQGVVYRAGGSVALVFPYGGRVGTPPAVEAPLKLSPPVPEKIKPFQRYAVQRGDTIVKIAKKFGIKNETVLGANNLKIRGEVRAGDTLLIPREDGTVYLIKTGGTARDVARKFGVTATRIARANGVGEDDLFVKGEMVLVPGLAPIISVPVKPKPNQKPQPVPDSTPEPVPTPEPSTLPSGEAPPPPDVVKRPPAAAGEKLFWPSTRRVVNQYFSAYHPGLDIDGDYSDSVYATDDGTVIYSGWINNGYGNMVLIDHGNGMQSRYAHNSRVFVSVGQFVNRGDTVARVGTTGRSTGSHLHFEIIVNGKRVNPFKYLR